MSNAEFANFILGYFISQRETQENSRGNLTAADIYSALQSASVYDANPPGSRFAILVEVVAENGGRWYDRERLQIVRFPDGSRLYHAERGTFLEPDYLNRFAVWELGDFSGSIQEGGFRVRLVFSDSLGAVPRVAD